VDPSVDPGFSFGRGQGVGQDDGADAGLGEDALQMGLDVSGAGLADAEDELGVFGISPRKGALRGNGALIEIAIDGCF
jgi:hypothetical protein